MHFPQTALATLPFFVRLVSAHGWVNSWVIDGGKPKNGFVPSDPGRFPVSAERPTDNPKHGWAEPTDPIVACGGLSPGEGRETWDIQGGSSITVNWISDDRLEPNMVWPAEHRGPIMEYMAECPGDSCDGVDAASLQWFKISEQAGSGTQWATDVLNQTRSWTFQIPENVKSGAYLVRHELIALHNVSHPQIYPVCIQTRVTSSGTGVPSETVTFPDAYQDFEQDFREIDIWNQAAFSGEFVPPGPRVASLDGSVGTSGSGTAASGAASRAAAPSASSGSSGSTGDNATPNDSAGTDAASSADPASAQPTGPSAPSATAVSGSGAESDSGGQASDVTQDSAPVGQSSPVADSPAPSSSPPGGQGRGGGRGRGSRSRGPHRGASTGSASAA